MSGRFVTFEGGEGAGKTTQLARLAEWLKSRGLAVVTTREPGGTEGAEAIRRLLVEGAADRWDALSELLLVAAARRDHLVRVIEPALARGAWVLCDRYVDSTRVYQGLAGGLGLERVDRLHRDILVARRPDLTLVLDVPVQEGMRRRAAAGAVSRFEQKGEAYHDRIREGFLELAQQEPGRVRVVDAAQAPDDVTAAVIAIVAERFGLATA